jgi:2-iminobutanoate/2-iminopropanoate deaminase
MTPEPIWPTEIHETIGYSHAVRAGRTLYVSGQVARDPENRIVGVGNVEVQTRQVFANLQRVLEAAGANLRSVVKMTTYLTKRRDFQVWRGVRDEVFEAPYPASTLVVVADLSYPEYLVEIEAIAVLDG